MSSFQLQSLKLCPTEHWCSQVIPIYMWLILSVIICHHNVTDPPSVYLEIRYYLCLSFCEQRAAMKSPRYWSPSAEALIIDGLKLLVLFRADEYCHLGVILQDQASDTVQESTALSILCVWFGASGIKPVTQQKGTGMPFFIVNDENKILMYSLREGDNRSKWSWSKMAFQGTFFFFSKKL